MRRFLTISSLDTGGAERVLTTLANAWAEAGHDVTLATTHDDGRAPHFPLSPRVRLRSASVRGGGFGKQLRIIRNLRRLIHEDAPDVVISFLNYTNVLTLLACRGLPIPVVVSERADPRLQPIGAAWSSLRRIAYRRAAGLVAQTATAARLYEPLAPGRVSIVPNPVVEPGGAIGLPRDGRMILAVGRLHHLKGFDTALRAMAALPPQMADWRLVILGEGPARAELEELRQGLGLGARVELPGQVADPSSWLRAADIFLLSSRAEGFPNVLCEAMAAGLPAVATDCPSGPADIITPGVDGLLVPAADPAAMAAALARLIEAPDLRRQLAARAPEVLQRFSLPTVLAAWERVLAQVTSGERH
jgi:GalNAc-alpha-(1->4)-GalNAc-alpha-(1->3)-diNAcBac-PP-undecaprenol alpha-1,4-N-acetyl-D-galactosaminyltransferase